MEASVHVFAVCLQTSCPLLLVLTSFCLLSLAFTRVWGEARGDLTAHCKAVVHFSYYLAEDSASDCVNIVPYDVRSSFVSQGIVEMAVLILCNTQQAGITHITISASCWI